MTTLAVEVMHVPGVYPERDACVLRIAKAFQAEGFTVTVHLDRVGNGPWHTMRRCLKHGAESGADLVLVIQDDVSWPAGLGAWVLRALAELPDHCAAQLYSGVWRAKLLERMATAGSWIKTQACPGGLATVMTRAGATAFVAWANRSYRPEYHHSDERLTWWLIAHGGSLYVPMPCLVQHQAPTHKESLLGHTKTGESVSRYYIGDAAVLRGSWAPLEAAVPYKHEGLRSYDFDARAWTLLGRLELIQRGVITQEFWDAQLARRPATLDVHQRPLRALQERLRKDQSCPKK